MADEKQTHENLGDNQEIVEHSLAEPSRTILLSNALLARRAFVQYDLLTLLGLGLAIFFTSFGILTSNAEVPNFTSSFIWTGAIITLSTLLVRSPFWLTFKKLGTARNFGRP